MLRKSQNSKFFSFTPNENWTNGLVIDSTQTTNDAFESHDAVLTTKGKLVICNDVSKLKLFCKKIVKESYQEYLTFIEKYDSEKDRWIYNIIDGIEEQQHILYQDDQIIIIPDYKWNKSDKTKLHILTIPKDKSLRSIRSLNSSHVELLNHCKNKTCEIIENIFDVDIDSLKMYFHYAPTTWHLHIHFVHLQNSDVNSSVEYSHDLDSVIYNITICNDYYKNILNKRI